MKTTDIEDQSLIDFLGAGKEHSRFSSVEDISWFPSWSSGTSRATVAKNATTGIKNLFSGLHLKNIYQSGDI